MANVGLDSEPPPAESLIEKWGYVSKIIQLQATDSRE